MTKQWDNRVGDFVDELLPNPKPILPKIEPFSMGVFWGARIHYPDGSVIQLKYLAANTRIGAIRYAARQLGRGKYEVMK